MTRRIGTRLLLLLLVAPYDLAAQTPTANPAIDRVMADYIAAFNAKDPVKLASLYAEDAVLMPADEPTLRGRAAIQGRFRRQFAQGLTDLRVKTLEAGISGQHGFRVGTVEIQVGPDPTRRAQARFVTLFKRVGNDWKISYDMLNGNMLLPPGK